MEKKRFVKNATPYLFVLPWIIGFIVFTAGLLILSMVMSSFDWPITSPPTFREIGNYAEVSTKDKQFYRSLTITLKYAMVFVPLNMVIALFLAMLITQPVRGAEIYRTILYIPVVVPGVAIFIIWGWILNGDYGVLSYLLSLIGIEGSNWLVDPVQALLAVTLVSASGVETMMLIFYTDTKSTPIDLYEAVSLDGVSSARQFFSATLLIIMPTILFSLITSLISAFQQPTLVMLLINDGPLKSTYFYGMLTYNNVFKHRRLGHASANVWVMFIIILFLTAIVFKSSLARIFHEMEAESGKAKNKKEGGKTL